MVVKKSDGYYVVSEQDENLGGPYRSKKKAQDYLRQVKVHEKHEGGDKLEGMLKGPSHDEGGVKFKLGNEIQEAEGGEYVVRKEAVQKLEEMYGKGVFDEFINKGMLPPDHSKLDKKGG